MWSRCRELITATRPLLPYERMGRSIPTRRALVLIRPGQKVSFPCHDALICFPAGQGICLSARPNPLDRPQPARPIFSNHHSFPQSRH